MTVWTADQVVGQPVQPEMMRFLRDNGVDPNYVSEVEDVLVDGPALRICRYVVDDDGYVQLREDEAEIACACALVLRRTGLPSWWRDTP